MKIRDRIKEFKRVKASEILPNPKNWRTHPKAQKDALKGLLAEIGFAGAVLARETPNGLMLIDGHLRTETMSDAEIPVLILDVDEAEANKILATFDPISAMAESDAAALDKLLREVQTSNEAVAGMLTQIAEDAGILDGKSKEEIYTRKIEAPIYEPKNEKPDISELVSKTKTHELLASIESSSVPQEIKDFLKLAAHRHNVFNYELIADFYAHSDSTIKKLMEESFLVLIDFDKAIENGYIKAAKEFSEMYEDETGEKQS